eukprot:6668962-Prymnesium_polylepis.3
MQGGALTIEKSISVLRTSVLFRAGAFRGRQANIPAPSWQLPRRLGASLSSGCCERQSGSLSHGLRTSPDRLLLPPRCLYGVLSASVEIAR